MVAWRCVLRRTDLRVSVGLFYVRARCAPPAGSAQLELELMGFSFHWDQRRSKLDRLSSRTVTTGRCGCFHRGVWLCDVDRDGDDGNIVVVVVIVVLCS